MRNGLAPILFGRPSWVPYGSTLAFDFTRGRGWTPNAVRPAAGMLTTTRASDAYADSNSGFWQAFTSGQPRITDKGLLVEESRTNSIRNNSMQGAVAGTPGTEPTNWLISVSGLITARTIVGADTEDGIDVLELSLTASGAGSAFLRYEGATQIAAASGQTWTASHFVEVVSGPVTVAPFVGERDAAGVNLDFSVGTPAAPSSLTRQSITRLFDEALTAFALPAIQVTFSGAGTAVIRIGWPQLELGAFATSPIRTTSAAATRALDSITRTISSPSVISIYAEAVTPNNSQASVVVNLDTGPGTGIVIYRDTSNRIVIGVISGGVTQAAFTLSAVANNTAFKVAGRFAADDFAVCLNGGAVSADTSGTMPSGMTTLRVGTDANPFAWNSTIKRLALFDGTLLPNAQLQALTT